MTSGRKVLSLSGRVWQAAAELCKGTGLEPSEWMRAQLRALMEAKLGRHISNDRGRPFARGDDPRRNAQWVDELPAPVGGSEEPF